MDLFKKLTKIFEAVDPVGPAELVGNSDSSESDDVEAEIDPDVAPEPVEKEPEVTAGKTKVDNIPDAKPGRTLDDLKKVKLPLQNGWTFDEVVAAMKSSLINKAKKYNTPTFSFDESFAAGMEGLWKAAQHDKGIASFPTHAFRWMDTTMARAAAAAQNVSGAPKSSGGKLNWTKQHTVSADVPAPGSDSESPMSAQIPSAETEADSARGKAKALIRMLLDKPEVNLSKREKLLLMATAGIGMQGQTIEPIIGTRLAQLMGADGQPISPARMSQIRTSAYQKIRDYLDSKGVESQDKAMDKFNIGEAVLRAFINVIKESIKLELEMLQEHQTVKMSTMISGVPQVVSIKINSESLEVVDAQDRFSESVLANVPANTLHEAKLIAKSKTDEKFFIEAMNEIFDINMNAILESITPVEISEICIAVVKKPLRHGPEKVEAAKRVLAAISTESPAADADLKLLGLPAL